MGEFILEESYEPPIIPDGEVLAAEVVQCEDRETPFDDEKNPGHKKWQVSFSFLITEGEFAGQRIFGNTPMTFTTHSDCKLRIWVQEILGVDELPAKFKFNTEAVVGLPCRVAVAIRESQQANGKMRQKNYVSDVLAARTGSAKTAEEVF